MDYHVVDRPMGIKAVDLETALNSLGADSWFLIEHFLTQYEQRRSVFKKVQSVVEYLVTETNTGRTAEEAEAALDANGANGWELITVYPIMQDRRRAIYSRGGNGGGGGISEAPIDGNLYGRINATWGLITGVAAGIPEAPLDGNTYGRLNATWNWAIAHDNDVLDGGSF